jgi:hypothetical protein
MTVRLLRSGAPLLRAEQQLAVPVRGEDARAGWRFSLCSAPAWKRSKRPGEIATGPNRKHRHPVRPALDQSAVYAGEAPRLAFRPGRSPSSAARVFVIFG